MMPSTDPKGGVMARIETIMGIFRVGVIDRGQLIRMTMLKIVCHREIQEGVGIARARVIRMHG